ncbi:hypothetical protein AB1Y20_017300 [Prymnesium parvum]|uniref:Uncharacterized protein n=1 Tax=Prymnesium parvum TaxID=97485 RepID=A0AB34JN09_PRYPA
MVAESEFSTHPQRFRFPKKHKIKFIEKKENPVEDFVNDMEKKGADFYDEVYTSPFCEWFCLQGEKKVEKYKKTLECLKVYCEYELCKFEAAVLAPEVDQKLKFLAKAREAKVDEKVKKNFEFFKEKSNDNLKRKVEGAKVQADVDFSVLSKNTGAKKAKI